MCCYATKKLLSHILRYTAKCVASLRYLFSIHEILCEFDMEANSGNCACFSKYSTVMENLVIHTRTLDSICS